MRMPVIQSASQQGRAADWRRLTPLERLTAVGGVLLTLACFAYLFAVALGRRAQFPVHGDETYFAMCAIRGALSNEVMAGCHDNKGPVIYAAYQWVALWGDLFNPATLKLAACGLLAAIILVGGAVAMRVAGMLGAALFGAALALAVASNPVTVQFNTDTFGTVFVLLAIWLLTCERLSLGSRASLAGVALGLAAMTKQTFVAYALPALWWLLVAGTTLPCQRRRLMWQPAVLFLAALVLPCVAMGILFHADGRLSDFVASTFLYPATYGSSGAGSLAKGLAHQLLQIQDMFYGAHLALIGFGFAGWWLLATGPEIAAEGRSVRRAVQLVLAMSVMALVLLLGAPVVNVRLAVTFFALAAVCAGAALATAAPWRAAPAAAKGLTAVAVCVLVAAGVLNVWTANPVVRPGDGSFQVAPLGEARGKLGYVYGVWPQLYYFNGMLPASDVLYSTALRGSLQVALYRPPTTGSRLAAEMDANWARNERKLMRDFESTPPAYIVITDNVAPENPASVRSGVAALDAYVARRCRFERSLQPPKLSVADTGFSALFRCN